MVYIVCFVFLLILLSLAIDRGTSKNVARLILILLGLLAFAAYLVWRLVQKAG